MEEHSPERDDHRDSGADFGPLQRFVDRPDVTDVLVNGADDLWLDAGAGLERVKEWDCPDEHKLRALGTRLIALGGRHIDDAHPVANVRLGNGVRVHVVLPPVSGRGTLVSLRVPAAETLTLNELASRGAFGVDAEAPAVREFIQDAVQQRKNLLISGPAGSGKTTLLGALLSSCPSDQRIIALEDVAELRVEHPHFLPLEARQANTEGRGGISVRDLLREALRMRPDRLVLGECRGPEVLDLFSALNTGHDGGAGTLHASSLDDVPARLEALGALAGLTPQSTARQAVSAIDLVVHLSRTATGRRVNSIGRPRLDDDNRLGIETLYGN